MRVKVTMTPNFAAGGFTGGLYLQAEIQDDPNPGTWPGKVAVPPLRYLDGQWRRAFFCRPSDVDISSLDFLRHYEGGAAFLAALDRLPDTVISQDRRLVLWMADNSKHDLRCCEVCAHYGVSVEQQGAGCMASVYRVPDVAATLLQMGKNEQRRRRAIRACEGEYALSDAMKTPLLEKVQDIPDQVLEDWAASQTGLLFAPEMGATKTRLSLSLGRHLVALGAATRVVMVTHAIDMTDQYRQEWEAVGGKPKTTVKLSGASWAKHAEKWKDEDAGGDTLFVTNYEQFRDADRMEMGCRLAAGAVVIFDEVSTKARNFLGGDDGKEGNWHRAYTVARQAAYVLPMSGTPSVTQAIGDVWSALALADPIIIPEGEFKERFLVMKPKAMTVISRGKSFQIERMVPTYQRMQEFSERVAPHLIRVRTEDVNPDLPTGRHEVVEVPEGDLEVAAITAIAETSKRISPPLQEDIDKAIRYGGSEESVAILSHAWSSLRAQQALDDPYILWLAGDKEANGTSVTLRAVLRLLESQGWTREKAARYIPEKARAMAAYLEKHPDASALVFTQYIDVAERYAGHLRTLLPGRDVVAVTGSSSSSAKRGVADRLDQPGAVAICSDAMSKGYNLQAADLYLEIDPPFSADTADQRRRRVLRGVGGGEKPCVLFHVPTCGVEERRMFKAASRRRAADAIFGEESKNPYAKRSGKSSVDRALGKLATLPAEDLAQSSAMFEFASEENPTEERDSTSARRGKEKSPNQLQLFSF